MASFDGSRTVLGLSDELFEHVCSSCDYRGSQKAAHFFCNDCRELLCGECADAHKGLKLTRNHNLVGVDDAPSEIVNSMDRLCTVLCDCGQNSEVDVYCRYHRDVICEACHTIKHRRCDTVSIGEISVTYPADEFCLIDQSVNELNAKNDKLLRKRQCDLKTLSSLKEKAKREIKNFKTEISRQLDLMEKDALMELHERDTDSQNDVQLHISSCTTTERMLEADLKLIGDVQKTASKADMFAASVKISKRITKYKSLLDDISWESSRLRSFAFSGNEELNDMLGKITKLGLITQYAVKNGQCSTKNFADLAFTRIRQINLKAPDDNGSPYISGCVFMPDGQVVLCDHDNQRLKLLSEFFTIQGNMNLPSKPWDISVVNDSEAIITVPGRQQLQYIEVVPRLKQGRIIQLDKACWGVEVVDDYTYITCRKGWSGEGEVRILDREGNLINRLGVNQDGSYMFARPNYLTVNTGSNRVYVSDHERQTLTCLHFDGTVAYRYKDRNLNRPRGMCSDDDDNVMVCGEDSNVLHVVNALGKKHTTLLTAKNGLNNPVALAYRNADNVMIIGSKGHDKLFVCNFMHLGQNKQCAPS